MASASEGHEQIQRALDAIDRDDVDAARDALDRAAASLGETDPRVLHGRGIYAWAEGDIEEAARMLLEAADAGPEESRIYLDCAELLLDTGLDFDAAESTLHALLQREALDEETRWDAQLMLAQSRLEHPQADPEEALELLDAVPEARREADWRSLRAATYLDLGRASEAVQLLEASAADPAVEVDPDLQYQLGICYAAAGVADKAVAAMVRVVELDAEQDDYDEIDADERMGLRAALEEVLEDLPDALLKRVAPLPIEVQTRATAEQIGRGVDPRAFLAIDGDVETAEARAFVIMRNVLLDEVDHEEMLPEALFSSLTDEFRRFFGLEELATASA